MATSTLVRFPFNLRSVQSRCFHQLADNGNSSLDVISAYPQDVGIFRVANPASIAGLPDNTQGYGFLLIMDAGSYTAHIYIDMHNNLYISRTGSAAVPTTWKQATTTTVDART